MKKKKLRNTRPKALFGEVAAAGITAAATLAAAGIGAAATAKAAKEQAGATIEQAKQQSAAIEQTNINNNQLQQQSQQFIAQENEANRQIQRDLQMNLQLQSGQLDMEQRRAASRIQVKKGGKVKSRKKLRDAQLPLWGSNTGIKVTDGGYLEPIGYSPEGYPLYKAVGDTHKQYHKVGKKYKSGIGIKVPGRETIEVENGETIADRLLSPHGDVAIASRLSHNGAYPAQMIDAGAPVDDVINMQELVNIHNGNSPVERNRYKALAGVSTNYILPVDYPMNDLGFDMSGVNIATARRSLRKGGRCKAANGNIIGGWITGLGNLGGGILTGLGSYWGGKRLAKAYSAAGDYLANAYDNLRTVDMSGIRRDIFGNQHYMPVVRSTTYNVNDQLGDVTRSANASMKAVNNNTLSSAARLSRMSGINDAVLAAKSKIYADKYNKEEAVKQQNNAALNEAAKQNVLMDVEASKDFTKTYVDLLKYNNDIVNEGILGKSQALADSIMGAAQARATGNQGLWSNIGTGIATGAAPIGSGYAAAAAEEHSRQNAMLIADLENKVDYYANGFGNQREKDALLSDLQAKYDAAVNPEDKVRYQHYINRLNGTVATAPKKNGKLSLRDHIAAIMDAAAVDRKYKFNKEL